MIRTTHIDLGIVTNKALTTYIDDFCFIHEEGQETISVELQHGETYTLIDEIIVNPDNFTTRDLERKALNWIFKNVEIVDLIEEEEVQLWQLN